MDFSKGAEQVGKQTGDDIPKRAVDEAYKNQRDAEIKDGVDPQEAQKRYEQKRDEAFDRIDNPPKQSPVERAREFYDNVWPPIKEKWFPNCP